MIAKKYILVIKHNWHETFFNQFKKQLPGKWFIVKNEQLLNYKYLNKIKPHYIFFPHWSKKVDQSIVNNFKCICFHETDLPYGRGGTPIQNLILKNHKKTKISAIRMINEIDAGPIYLKRSLLLSGSAKEIYERAFKIYLKMIKKIVENRITPKDQVGKIINFSRRIPEQSRITSEIKTLDELYNHIRMLDAEDYPSAFLEFDKFKFEFINAKKNGNVLTTEVKIKSIKKSNTVKNNR